MADLTSILTALALSSAWHPIGHEIAGNETNVPVSINWGSRTDSWNTPDIKKDTRINAGGFSSQDLLAEMLGGDFRKAAGLYKLGYLSGLTLPKGPTGQTIRGDINNVKQLSGNKAYPAMMMIDALSDIGFDNDKRSISTKVTDSGTPTIRYNVKF